MLWRKASEAECSGATTRIVLEIKNPTQQSEILCFVLFFFDFYYSFQFSEYEMNTSIQLLIVVQR